jgi:predicted MPP superfamily phosphohydrolase
MPKNRNTKPRKLLTRRRVLAAAGGGLAVLAGGAAYARWIEPFRLAVDRVSVAAPADRPAPRGLRIALMTDLHRSSLVPDSHLAEAVRLANGCKPDLILLGGDYITGPAAWAEGLPSVLKEFVAPLGVFAVLGNHDGGAWAVRRGGPGSDRAVVAALRRAGAEVLVNQNRVLYFRRAPFRLVGLGDAWAEQSDAEAAFSGVRPDEFVIVLCHNPDMIPNLAPFPGDLTLCGHTHGGQVRIPLLGAPFAPVRHRRFIEGLHDLGARHAYISRGVGMVVGFRLNCRPQVSVLDIA